MVTPTNQVRRSIMDRSRYNPESPNKALRVSTLQGMVEVTVKQPGDLVISNIGVSEDEQPPRSSSTQEC